MSRRALEFVETWVENKIEEMGQDMGNAATPGGDAATARAAQAKALAAQCVVAALDESIPESEINEAFDDLAAFIAGQLEEAQEREAGSDEDTNLVEDDDTRVVDGEEDDALQNDK